MPLQLQQVSAAGQSTEMTMKDEEQPVAAVVGKPVDPTLDVGEFKRNRAGDPRHLERG